MTSNTEHQLKLKILQERLDNISNDFERELITYKIHEKKQEDSLHKNLTSSLQQEPPQTNRSLIPPQEQPSQQSKPKQSTTQMWQQISSEEHPTFQEDLKSEEYLHSLSNEKVFQKVKLKRESWKYIPREKLERLKKKTLGYVSQKNKQ